ncbi:hypothetical protein OX283_013210 [Flavobacterium sp. SUN052]|uniref:hypothetical protein n=1 Tax=Flavobacterium sp. SUN052 TaxID=3002441 RepID=UPI00237E15BB|nr:hypothetical protein [Flavobacterium sp. SUN052]MEC4005622.1 hypothetical protein [Flavobacterium sp. SUN052]
MKTKLLILLVFLPILTFAQTPFTTISMEPINVQIEDGKTKTFKFNEKEFDSIKSSIKSTGIETLNLDDVKNKDTYVQSEKKPLDFFNNSSLSNSLINTGGRVSINAEVLHYKLYIANPSPKYEKDRKYRFNIPLLIISKLSTKYDSISSSSAWDAVDYEAAPVTLRIMPSFRKSFVKFNDVFYFGFYADLRGLNIQNTVTNKYDLEFIGASGLGFTFQGDGDAGKYNEKGEYKQGKYSISFMLQGATGKKEILQKLFKTNNEYVTSLQTYFMFKVSDDSNLNIKIGYQYLFKETLSGSKSNFSIALGL